MKKTFLWMIIGMLLLIVSCSSPVTEVHTTTYLSFQEPKHYLCPKVDEIQIDGKIDEWDDVLWTDFFNDIEGADKAKPRYSTRAKIAWNDEYLFIAAEMEEPDVWATITERDAVIFYDNDFEVFIDPDGDTHHYYELEINAFETAWDLLLTMPYRDFGFVIDNWDINGMLIGVSVDGTINDPSDKDVGWTIEIALPFNVLEECSGTDNLPEPGDYWRINFSRVEWKTEVVDGKYQKQINPETGKAFPEDNWVWSPQYHINMHMPEYWGFLVFVADSNAQKDLKWEAPAVEETKWVLRNIYYMQQQYFVRHSNFAESMVDLGWDKISFAGEVPQPDMVKTHSGYEAALKSDSGEIWIINEKGRVYKNNL
jgi:hypothetical protein